jgi:hypothetical protein
MSGLCYDKCHDINSPGSAGEGSQLNWLIIWFSQQRSAIAVFKIIDGADQKMKGHCLYALSVLSILPKIN